MYDVETLGTICKCLTAQYNIMQAMFEEKEIFKTNRNVASRCLWATVLKESQRLSRSENLALFINQIKWNIGCTITWDLAVKAERLHMRTHVYRHMSSVAT